MTTASPTYRLSTALVALLFALGWGVPAAPAACMSGGAMGAGHCGGSETEQHCDGEMGGPSPVCVTHHASQEARSEAEASVDLLPPSGDDQPVRSSDSAVEGNESASRLLSARPAAQRDRRLHVHVGVWLE